MDDRSRMAAHAACPLAIRIVHRLMGYLEELESALERAALGRRRRVRPSPAAALAVVALVVAGTLGSLAVLGKDSADASTIAVRVEGHYLFIRIVRPSADPNEVVHDLAGADLRSRLVEAPTGPSRVGQLISLSALGNGVTSSGRLDVRVPIGWPGIIEVSQGVPANPGQTYTAVTNAFEDDEPLGCLSSLGATVAQVKRVAKSRSVTVEWRSYIDDRVIEPPSSHSRVESAVATSDDSVIARVDVEMMADSDAHSECG